MDMTHALLPRRHFLSMTALGALATACGSPPSRAAERFPFALSEAEWRKRLSPAAYGVLREGDTERPYSSPLNKEKRRGIYGCAGCGLPLFLSSTKFESGTGWPSFYRARENAVIERADTTLGMRRTETLCRRCGGHLGHVFDDGPPPTGLRYCMNGVALTFTPA
jgi:peptide-methionine (R)-S-oxide reductase